jgi:low affinity Fe/Cu permease
MVIKRVIGIVVCSVLLSGNCVVSASSDDDAAVTKKEFKALEKKLDELIKGLNRDRQPEERETLRFKSAEQARRYIRKIKGEFTDENKAKLNGYMEGTVEYFMNSPARTIGAPRGVNLALWRQAKIFEIFHEIKKSFGRNQSVMDNCKRIVEAGNSGIILSEAGDVECLKLLLVSQCVQWQEKRGELDVQLMLNYRKNTVREAIDLLQDICTSDNDDEKSREAREFLNQIKEKDNFKKFFKDEDNSEDSSD